MQDSDNESLDGIVDEHGELNQAKYREFLATLWPSNHSRMQAGFQALKGGRRTPPAQDAREHKRVRTDANEHPASDSDSSYDPSESTDDTDTKAEGHTITLTITAADMCSDSESDDSDASSGSDRAGTAGSDKDAARKKRTNLRRFKSLMRGRNMLNDVDYFADKLSATEQTVALQKFEELAEFTDVAKPYCLQLLDTDLPNKFKAVAYRKISALRNLEPGSGEHHKARLWVDTFMRIPFGKYKEIPVTLDTHTTEECSAFMDGAKKTLDAAVYGMDDVKGQFYQLIGQWIANPAAVGAAIGIQGPMGTGKTTLVKDGISKVLGRDFIFMALGGATDSSFLEGHSYTYEGSTFGKIVDGLVKIESMNPVFFFDELDKVSETPKGDEIIGILTHLTDLSQNTEFHDRYFSEVSFDLSRALFIFSYNDEKRINPILRDRMYKLQTKGYNTKEKNKIATGYLLPNIRVLVSFTSDQVRISDEVICYIVERYTDKEKGVRNLKRCLEVLHTKLNLCRLVTDIGSFFQASALAKVRFPIVVTKEIVDALLSSTKDDDTWKHMYM